MWIVLTWFDKLLYPVWISLIFSVHTFYSWIRRWWDFHSHSTVQSTNTRLTYDTVWFSFEANEGGKDTEVKLSYCVNFTFTQFWYTLKRPLQGSFFFPFKNSSENHLLKQASYAFFNSWHSSPMLFISNGSALQHLIFTPALYHPKNSTEYNLF